MSKFLILDLPKWSNTQHLFYAGVGSRNTPIHIQIIMNQISEWLEKKKGYTLRSGGALGADKAFEGLIQPWEKDSNKTVTRWSEYKYKVIKKEIFYAKDIDKDTEFSKMCKRVAKEIHPNPNLNGYPLKLHARNLFQVLGADLNSPVDFLICWTPRNKKGEVVTSHEQRDSTSGGTGQAISYASYLGIPIINLESENWRDELSGVLKSLKKTNI